MCIRDRDIDKLDAVVNFSLARDPQVNIHRAGRTGRAGKSGTVWSFYSNDDDYQLIHLQTTTDKSILPEKPPQPAPDRAIPRAAMVTLQIDGGKKQKLRAGDILGALTAAGGISGDSVGKITIFDNRAFVAVERQSARAAQAKLSSGKLKGRTFRVRTIY